MLTKFKKNEHNCRLGVTKQENGDFYFSVWAPKAQELTLEIRSPKYSVCNVNADLADDWAKVWHINSITDDEKSFYVKMKSDKKGLFSAIVSKKHAKNGDLYRYILTKNNSAEKKFLKDPRTTCQPHIFSWSQIYDQSKFKWSKNEKEWLENKNPARLNVKNPKMLQLNEFSYLEVHIPTATVNGDLLSFQNEIDKIAQQGFSGILLMPAEGTYDVNWGYDGVDKYAITRAWGKTLLKNVTDIDKVNDSLKALVDCCHQKNLNVGIDWVPSHITEEYGNILNEFAPYENVNTTENQIAKQWGGFTFNLEGKKDKHNKTILPISDDIKQVRRYITEIPISLIENYHFDFIRGDQSPNMYSNITMKLVKAEIDYHFPNIPVIWEDHRSQEHLTDPLCVEIDNSCEKNHIRCIEKIMNNDTTICDIGGDEMWDFDFSHALEANILGKEVWPAQPTVECLAWAFKADFKGTKFLLSHDEIGNHCGSRILVKYLITRLNLLQNIENTCKKEFLAAELAQKLLQLSLYEKTFSLRNQDNLNSILNYYCAKTNSVTVSLLQRVVAEALALDKLGHGCVYIANGSKMIFQGENYGEIKPFLFHRIQPQDETSISIVKGYDIGETAFVRSKLNINRNFNKGIYEYFKELNKMLKSGKLMSNSALCVNYYNNADKTLVLSRSDKNNKNKIFAFINFSLDHKFIEFEDNCEEKCNFTEIFNSNNVLYGGHSNTYDNFIIENNIVKKQLEPISLTLFANNR